MVYIYKITNKVNQKVYIGKTQEIPEERFKQHIRDSRRPKCQDRPLYVAINKHGIENFLVEKIEECSEEVGGERERHWIEVYDSFKNGYNATLGGDGTPSLDYELIYKTYLEVKSTIKTAEIIGCCAESVSDITAAYGITKEERVKNGRIGVGKPVAMVDKETGEILKTFASSREASQFLGRAGSRRHIQEVCKRKRRSAYGYFWKYL